MGVPIGAEVVYDDGRVERLAGPEGAFERAAEGRVALLYDYRPELVPPPGGAIDLWRYRSLLPLPDGPISYPLPVGGTPLIAPPQLRDHFRMPRFWLKDETRSPTGSNKDRATALVLEQLLRSGRSTVTAASTGNVAVSLAVGAAACGIRAVIFVPSEVLESKLSLMLTAGATVVKVREGYTAAFRLSRQAARQLGWGDRNTGVNPLTIEAKKTAAFEIWEQLGRRVPDAVVASVGDGTTLCALGKGFRELVACGVALKTPRLIGVQAEGCAPVARAWAEGRQIVPLPEGRTLADGIAVPAPACGAMVLREVALCGGGLVAVSDDAMLEAVGLLATRAGVLAEPAGAAAVAGVEAALNRGLLARDEEVVALVTGTGLKTLGFFKPAGIVVEIGGTLEELTEAIR